ncbi:MAG TPA: hypothetical protein ENJ17_01850 [Gammaproteobacteria bacterium]|nr:hypothetical protein [Gammaproteobacteria bacterium]
MSIDTQRLLDLLPAIHRIRDAELAAQQGLDKGPLEDLLAIIAEQLALLEENIEQSYDDLFIETCADWLTPYIGDLIGYQTLHGKVPDVASPRAEVAHTIALRRRKGTAVVLEQLARDVTGWNARAVEFFQQLGWTQYMNHPRDGVYYSPDLRQAEPLARIGSAFNSVTHSVDVRRAGAARGRFNIPNIGLFLWRIDAYPATRAPAQRLAPRRYLISPLGHPLPLYSRPRGNEGGFISALSGPENVPEPLGRRQLQDHLDSYYGLRATTGGDIDNAEPSLVLYVDGVEIPRDQVQSCNLSDDGSGWAHSPPTGQYAIDPVLGRVALPADAADPAEVQVSYHRGFSAQLGGGEYERQPSFALPDSAALRVPDDHATLQAALDALGGGGVVEITDNGRYEETLNVNVAANGHIELRAANGRNPHLALSGPLTLRGEEGSRFSINGCLLSGAHLEVPADAGNQLAQLDVAHCTWVPGAGLDATGDPVTPGAVSLNIALGGVDVRIQRSITGALRCTPEVRLTLTDSIVDATHKHLAAIAGLDGDGPGGALSAEACTVIGKIHVREMGTLSNCILLAGLAGGDTWHAPVWAERKQTGCVRFSYLPVDAIVPRRYRCQPDSASDTRQVSPRFTSLKYGQAAYGQLSIATAEAIRRGADDESEMGALHHLFAPQRERNLRIRLQEYLRVGLEAGLFYES